MKRIITYALPAIAFLPMLAFAQTPINTTGLSGTVTGLQTVANDIILLLGAVALVVFIYGLIRFVINAGDEEARKGAKSYMIYGIIAFCVLAGLYGIVNVIDGLFGVSNSTPISLPGSPTQN